MQHSKLATLNIHTQHTHAHLPQLALPASCCNAQDFLISGQIHSLMCPLCSPQVTGTEQAWSMILARLYPTSAPELQPDDVLAVAPIAHFFDFQSVLDDCIAAAAAFKYGGYSYTCNTLSGPDPITFIQLAETLQVSCFFHKNESCCLRKYVCRVWLSRNKECRTDGLQLLFLHCDLNLMHPTLLCRPPALHPAQSSTSLRWLSFLSGRMEWSMRSTNARSARQEILHLGRSACVKRIVQSSKASIAPTCC